MWTSDRCHVTRDMWHVTCDMWHMVWGEHSLCVSKTVRARKLKFWDNVHYPLCVLCHKSCVTYHMSQVMRHVSRVTCHVSHVHFFYHTTCFRFLEKGLLSTGSTPTFLYASFMSCNSNIAYTHFSIKRVTWTQWHLQSDKNRVTSKAVWWKVHPHTPIGCRKVLLLRKLVGKLLKISRATFLSLS